METGALTQRAPRRLPRRRRVRLPGGMGGWWALPAGLGLAVAAGVIAGGGEWTLAIAAVLAPVFLVVATAAPERTALGLIVLLPFSIYPASAGGFSLFLALPTFGFVSIVLLTRQHGSLRVLRRDLPAVAFGVLLTAAIVAAVASSETITGLSRVLYLILFGLFAFALATTLASGRLSRETVAKAVLVSGGLAGAAIVIQFLAQFGAGQGSVVDWLFNVRSLFGGEHAAEVRKSNWTVSDLDVVRGVFPFMSPPSAGQFMMLSLLAGVWLRRDRRAATPAGSALELGLLLIIVAALLFTFSRQAWLGAAIGLVALGLGRRPVLMLGTALLVTLVIAFVPIPGTGGSFGNYLATAGDTSSESTETRLDLWDQAIDLIPEHAVIGAGPGLIGELAPGTNDRPFYAHNIFLDGAVELGIAGAAALIAIIVVGLRAARRRASPLAFSMLFAFMVAGLFDDVLYLPRNGLLLAVAFALIAGTRKRDPEPESLPRAPRQYEPEPVEPDRALART
jgi:O-antigen ligase